MPRTAEQTDCPRQRTIADFGEQWTAYRDNEIGAAHPAAELFRDLDEAGLGPLLGPLCIGWSVFRVPTDAGEDLWRLLQDVVTGDPKRDPVYAPIGIPRPNATINVHTPTNRLTGKAAPKRRRRLATACRC